MWDGRPLRSMHLHERMAWPRANGMATSIEDAEESDQLCSQTLRAWGGEGKKGACIKGLVQKALFDLSVIRLKWT